RRDRRDLDGGGQLLLGLGVDLREGDVGVALAGGLVDGGELHARATTAGPPVHQREAAAGHGVLARVSGQVDRGHDGLSSGTPWSTSFPTVAFRWLRHDRDMERRTVIAGGAALGAAWLAGCRGGDPAPTPSPSPSTPSTVPFSTATTAAAPA